MKVGLRIDVDTFRGTQRGVPNLCRVLAEHGVRASFFFSVGPDNMGRHLWRLIRPSFLLKMLRTNAPSLYGWDILLRGVFWPGPIIARRLSSVLREAAAHGHEIGLHAWDHHAWQTQVERMNPLQIQTELEQGVRHLTEILGHPPTCSAVPAWRCTEDVLLEKLAFPFEFNSDCRGHSLFSPAVAGHGSGQPQIPVTLPTYDEVVGRNGIAPANYNAFLLRQLRPDALNVLAIHAEAEGICCLGLFEDWLNRSRAEGVGIVALGDLLKAHRGSLPRGSMERREVPGREGWASFQKA